MIKIRAKKKSLSEFVLNRSEISVISYLLFYRAMLFNEKLYVSQLK